MCKGGWCVRLDILKEGGIKKGGGGTKILKKAGANWIKGWVP